MQLNSKYIRRTTYMLVDKSRVWEAGGCHTYMLYNQGNVNVTINNVLILRPGQQLSGPTENPDIADHSNIDVQFDMLNDPQVVQPDTGPAPVQRTFEPGDPIPVRDTRLVVVQSFLELK